MPDQNLPEIRFAVNTSVRDKDDNYEILATDFKDTSGSIPDIAAHVKAGHAICAGLLGNRRRCKANVIGSNWVLVDVDNSDVERDAEGKPIKDSEGKTKKIFKHQLTIEEALEHDFIKKHCSLLYTTASHTAKWPKFRLIFVLPEYISDVAVLEAAIKFLLGSLPHDPACKDASRIFYGNTKAEFSLNNPDASLPVEWVVQAKEAAEVRKQETEQRLREWEENKSRFREYSAEQGLDIDKLVKRALPFIPQRCPGSGTYQESFRVLAALKDYYGESEAEAIAELWSPSIPGNDWQIGKMLRRMNKGGITIGTLFHIAKEYGFRFPPRVENNSNTKVPLRLNPSAEKTEETKETEETNTPSRPGFILNYGVSRRERPQQVPVTETPPKGIPGTATKATYSYSDKQWANRYCWESDGKQEEEFKYFYKLPDGTIKEGKGKNPWDGYNLAYSLEFVQRGVTKFLIVENEEEVEVLRELGVEAFTFAGQNWTAEEVKKELAALKVTITGGKLKPPRYSIVYLHKSFADKKKIKLIESCCEEIDFDFAPINILETFKEANIQKVVSDLGLLKFLKTLEDIAEQVVNSYVAEMFSFCQQGFKDLFGDKNWINVDGHLHYHTGTYYKESPDSEETTRITDYCDNFVVKQKKLKTYPFSSPRHVKQLLEWAKLKLQINPELINPPGFNCTNGVLVLKWEEGKPIFALEDHTPQHYYLYEPQVEYNPDANPEACEQLLTCLDKPQQTIVLRLLAASIDIDAARERWGRQIRAAIPVGTGSNGKDAIREVMSVILGKIGVTSISLGDFVHYDEGRKFAIAPLKYSRLNWASENTQSTRLDKIESLKLAVTANSLHYERKGQDHTEFICKAVQFFNLNNAPNLQGAMPAATDRFAVIAFNKTFMDNPDPNNPNQLKADPRFAYDKNFVRNEVAPGFLNKLIQAFKDLIEEGIDYSCTKDAFQDAQKVNCHLFQFIQDSELEYSSGGQVTAKDVWAELEPWYIRNGTLFIDEFGRRHWTEQARPSDRNVKGMNQVIPRFMHLFPDAKIIQIYDPVGKHNVQCIEGIRFKPKEPSTNPTSDFTTRTTSDPVTTQFPTQFSAHIKGSAPPDPVLLIPGENNESNDNDESNKNKKSSNPSETGSGGAEVPPGKENWVGKWVGTGSGNSKTGSGAATIDLPPTLLPQDVQNNLVSLQHVIRAMSWNLIAILTAFWSEDMKQAVWGRLSPEDQKSIRDNGGIAADPHSYIGKRCFVKTGEYAGQWVTIKDYIEEDTEFGVILRSEDKECFVVVQYFDMSFSTPLPKTDPVKVNNLNTDGSIPLETKVEIVGDSKHKGKIGTVVEPPSSTRAERQKQYRISFLDGAERYSKWFFDWELKIHEELSEPIEPTYFGDIAKDDRVEIVDPKSPKYQNIGKVTHIYDDVQRFFVQFEPNETLSVHGSMFVPSQVRKLEPEIDSEPDPW